MLPALSRAVAVYENVPAPPAAPPGTLTSQPSGPESASCPMHDAVGTAPSVWIAPGVMPLSVIVGLTASMLMPPTMADFVLSALSVAWPVADWPALLSVSVTGCAQVAMPDMASPQVKPRVTAPVYQPLLPLGPAMTAPWMLGAVLSSLTSALADPPLPALSNASPEIHWLAVSGGTRTSGVTLPSSTPEPASVARKPTVTSSRFHPPRFGIGESTGFTT